MYETTSVFIFGACIEYFKERMFTTFQEHPRVENQISHGQNFSNSEMSQ